MPWRAWVMLEAMQASSDCAPAFAALASTQTWTAGVIVAQLMNSLPRARLKQAAVINLLHRLVVGDDREDDVGAVRDLGQPVRLPAAQFLRQRLGDARFTS